MKVLNSIRSVTAELGRWWNATSDFQSWLRIASDVLMLKLGGRNNAIQHTIKLKKFGEVSYRLNKGDLWSLREVLLDECYRFPGDMKPRVIVDLGGNIGLTSLWMSYSYAPERIVTVEPVATNAALARQNLAKTRSDVLLIEAAVGSKNGSAQFEEFDESNKGRLCLDHPGLTRVATVATLLDEAGITSEVDLLKVDIEGGEADLFSGDLAWLGRVKALIMELHPDLVDTRQIIETIKKQGFKYIPSNSVFNGNMDAFVRL